MILKKTKNNLKIKKIQILLRKIKKLKNNNKNFKKKRIQHNNQKIIF